MDFPEQANAVPTALACGGRGGSGSAKDSDFAFLGGQYSGVLVPTESDCPADISISSINWVVSQDGEDILVNSGSGPLYVGTVNNKTSWLAQRDSSAPGCEQIFSHITASQIADTQATINITLDAICGGEACVVMELGYVAREIG